METKTTKADRDKLEFIEFVTEQLEELSRQFEEKQSQYGTLDPLANFRTGALINYGVDDMEAMFHASWDYECKHLAHVANHGINGKKVDESLKDIAIYSMIQLYMVHKYNQGKV